MAAVSVKQEVHRASPGLVKMAAGAVDGVPGLVKMAGGVDGVDKLGEKPFSAMQGLVMAEDRRAREKERELGLQNLMEYREAPASPSASSVTTTLSLENGGSPGTPSSPLTSDVQDMDAERLPNELLDELYEDIGMKEGMELDFVEYLMEQDVDPQTYMTAEGLRSSGFPTPTASQANSALNTPTNKSNEQWGNRSGSPSYSIASSTNVTIATSSGSSSPVSKRFHLSTSGPPSPIRTQPPPLSHMGVSGVFKAPQTPPTPRRSVSTPSQSAAPPRSNASVSSNHSSQSSHSDQSNHSSHSNQSSVNSNQNSTQNQNVPRSVPGGMPSPQLPHSTTGTFNKPPPQYGQYQGQGQMDTQSNNRQQPCGNNVQKTPMNNQPYHRLGRPVPPNVNVQNFQQNNKWIPPQPGMGNNNACAMNQPGYNSGNLGNMQGQGQTSQYGRPVDSPLDQGYFTSSDSTSVRSFSSNSTSAVPNMPNNMQPMNSQKPVPVGPGPTTPQKSVHFAENEMPLQRQPSNEGLPYEPCYRTNVPDCELEEYRNSIQKMQSKMMPRLNHHVKPETAPYTVPSSGTGVNPYDFSNANMSGPSGNMQQCEYEQKPANDTFGMDNNQNLVMHNFNDGSTPNNMNNANCHLPSSCSGPMGMQPHMDPFRDQSQCQMQDPSKGSMFDPMNMQNNMYKNNSQLTGDNSNCQFSGASQGNSGMMGMNPAMMGNQNGVGQGQHVDQNFNNTPGYQGMPNSQGYPAQQNMANHRPVHMNMSSAQSNSGILGYDQFEQNRAMNNGENAMFPPNQTEGMPEGMGWNGGMPQTPQQPNHMGMTPRSIPMNMPQQGMSMCSNNGPPCGQLTGGPCDIPACLNCKSGSPTRPPMMASQQRFIQHLITDKSNAFRSHPLFPLLRDLIIADMNFSTPNFPYQLISNLPADFDKLLQNFLHRNPPAGNYQTNFAVESVVMDALKYAHQCLIEKIHQKQGNEGDKHNKSTSKSLSAIEEFCEKFDQSVRKSYIKPATLQVGGNPGHMGPQMGPMGPPEMTTPTKGMGMPQHMGMMSGVFTSPMAKKGLEFHGMMSPGFKSIGDFDGASDCGSVVSSSSHSNKPESKKHPSLPKEAVAIMLDWLRQHKDNPYPNDDEKAMLIKQTGLTINQINYWFTNARRRILPKWAQQCKT